MRFITGLLFTFICLLPAGSMAQNKVTLSGKVIDQHGTPIAQATIAVENTTSGTYTDDRGKYSLQVAPGKHTFIVSFLGYQTVKQSLDIRQDKKQNFTLQESTVTLSSVEVYGKTQTQKVKEGAFAVNALDIKPIVNSLNNLNDLVNRTTGIKVREEGGVGSDFDLSINGMSGNSIRYFLDGIPLDTKGSGVSLANLPVNIIDRIEIYKGVVPASLGTDALGGAINIITKQEKKNYLDVSYGIGSFHTHKADLNAQFVEPRTGLIIKPTFGVNYSKNDYMMRDVEVWDEDSRKYILTDRRRFHDDYFSLFGQMEIGFANKSWADAFFVSASYSKVDKELQTGSVQSKVYGMAERGSDAWNISARYQKHNFIWKNMQLNAALSHTWDHSLTTDTAYRKYDWNGDYIVSSRNEITGRGRSMRHYKRPLTIGRANLDYRLNNHHSLNLNYLLSRIGNDRYDEADTDFEASNDILAKHVTGFSYNQSLLEEKMSNTFFVKNYINHLNIRQTDLSSITGSKDVKGTITKKYWGYGIGSRYTAIEPLSIKISYEHSVRLPLARELLGNTYSMEAIVKGKYYYQVPNSNDRFTKLQVTGNSIKIVQEQTFVQNTFKVRGYTHAWLDDHTLIIMAANGNADKVIWTKLNADDMRILAEGTLDLPLPEGAKVFTASGILTYNEKAGKLYYFYFGKDKSGRGGKATSNFLTAVINPSDMKVESNKVNTLAGEMAGSAYGELMQSCVMYDADGNLYLAAFTDANDIEQGHLLRIKKGETDFDASYEGYPNADGKLLTIQNLGNGKALVYARNDAAGTAIDSYSHYYSIININTGTQERLSYNGQEIPYSGGRFAQRSVIIDGKAYIGVNTEKANPCIYIYDIATGKVEKGAEIAEGYYFDMLRVIENDK